MIPARHRSRPSAIGFASGDSRAGSGEAGGSVNSSDERSGRETKENPLTPVRCIAPTGQAQFTEYAEFLAEFLKEKFRQNHHPAGAGNYDGNQPTFIEDH